MTRTSQELLRINAKLNVKRPDKMFKKQSDFHWIPFIYQSMKVMSAMKMLRHYDTSPKDITFLSRSMKRLCYVIKLINQLIN